VNEIKLGLERIYNLLNKLNNPQDKLKIIHIAGTNGKGSVGAYLEEILIRSGKKVGRYVSPAVFDKMEIIKISKESISSKIYNDKIRYLKQLESKASIFELETALAFWYFYEEKCDICILETGLGGRMDATNVVKCPICTVLTSISMDHMNFLGNSLKEIAYEKCGIIKKGTKLVTIPQDKEVLNVINDTVDKLDVDLYMVDYNDINDINYKTNETTFTYKDKLFTTRLIGKHQVENASLSIQVARCIGVEDKYIIEGVKNTIWQGRFDKINDNPVIILDGAHNEKAAYNLLDSVNCYYKNKDIVYVCGVLYDKEYEKMLKIMSQNSERIITFKPNNDRGLDSDILSQVARKYYKYVYNAKDITKAIKLALAYYECKEVGSLNINDENIDNKNIDNKKNSIRIDTKKYVEANDFLDIKAQMKKSDFVKFNDKETIIIIFGSLSFMKDIYERHECDE